MSATTIANKYAGRCEMCGGEVAPGQGIAVGTNGSPVSGRWVNGCPKDESS